MEDPYYETWPDFTAGETAEDGVARLAHTFRFMADKDLGRDAVQLMQMLAFGIGNATKENPYLCEFDESGFPYYQVIRGPSNEYLSEFCSPEVVDQATDGRVNGIFESLGWTLPNEESPNFHREYPEDAGRYAVAADAAEAWFRVSGSRQD